MGISEHKAAAPAGLAVRLAVISVSDTRSRQTDDGGALVETLAREGGFTVVARTLIPDDLDTIRATVRALVRQSGDSSGEPPHLPLAPGGTDALVLTGGTGIAPRDRTVEAVAPLFDRQLDGFGELFRMLSFAEIGPAAMLSRACAGIVDGVAVFLIPGSPAAIRLAMQRLILPELGHVLGELRRAPAAASWTGAPGGNPGSGQRHHHHGPDERDRR